ncbi:MAG TPA: cytochrome c [Steroidobacteraceae bacterium]|nr:cytochrome c [Steroidobacteraceae bacterium]
MSSIRIHIACRRLPRSLLLMSLALLCGSILCVPAIARAADQSAGFDTNCAMCHQLNAAGVPGQFPRLAGRMGKIASTAAGRNYLERVVLFGMIGGITVDDTPIVGGVMPSFASLSDQDLADALDYIVSLDDAGKSHWQGAVFKPADIAGARAGKQLSPAEVHGLRAAAIGSKSP